VVWSGIDDQGDNNSEMERLGRISARTMEETDHQERVPRRYLPKWVVVPSCNHTDSPGSTCEFVAVTHWNHFSPSDLMPLLAEEKWEFPEEVGVLWKTEDHDQYHSAYLDENGAWPRPEEP
jgi:hypothetical protein